MKFYQIKTEDSPIMGENALNMKKMIALLLASVMMLSLAACGSNGNEEVKELETVGEFLLQDFKSDSEGSAQEIADRLIQNEVLPFDPVTMPVEPGFLTGFDNAEITGFKEGVMFAPMMGTIPFVGYIFVLEDGADVDGFVQTLEDSANLCWNICTEAEEMTVEAEGNTVFFLMSPKNFEE